MGNPTERKQEQGRLIEAYEKFMKEISQQVRVVQLRPKLISGLESNFHGDFDYLIRKTDFNTILYIIYETCKNSGVNFILHQKTLNKKRFEFFVKGIDDFCLIIEFWTAVEYTQDKVKKALACSDIFEAIDSIELTENEILSLLYITHLFHKKKDISSIENRYRFKVFLEKLAGEDRPYGNRYPAGLLQGLSNRSLTLAEANRLSLETLEKAGIKSSPSFLKYKLFLRRIWEKLFYLTRIIPVIGPDGVGKGSIAETALTTLEGWIPFRFKKLYRMRIPYKLRLALIPDWQSQPKNKLDEKIGYYIFFVVSGMIRALPIAKWGKHVLMDRYFIDYYAAPIRYVTRDRRPQKLRGYRLLLFLTPTPHNAVFMGCRDSSLNARKKELSEGSVVFLQKLYCEFISRKRPSKVLFLSTENPIDLTSLLLHDFLTRISHKKNEQ